MYPGNIPYSECVEMEQQRITDFVNTFDDVDRFQFYSGYGSYVRYILMTQRLQYYACMAWAKRSGSLAAANAYARKSYNSGFLRQSQYYRIRMYIRELYGKKPRSGKFREY